MIEAYALGLAVLFIMIPVGVAVYWGLLRLMDYALGVNFKHEYRDFPPMGKAIYAASRLLATAILVSQLATRFV